MKKTRKPLYVGLVATVLLVIAVAVAFLSMRDPLLFSNNVTVQVSTDKSSYLQGDEVIIRAVLFNGKSEALPCPTKTGFSVQVSNGTTIYDMWSYITWGSPYPTLAPHSKTPFPSGTEDASFFWNQRDSNLLQVESGNYTITVSLGEHSSQCTIEIRSNL